MCVLAVMAAPPSQTEYSLQTESEVHGSTELAQPRTANPEQDEGGQAQGCQGKAGVGVLAPEPWILIRMLGALSRPLAIQGFRKHFSGPLPRTLIKRAVYSH